MNSIMKAAAAVDSVKEAGVGKEFLGNALGTAIHPAAATAMQLYGMIDNDGRDERDVVDDSTWLPFVSSYRMGQRQRQVHDDFAADREAAGASNKMLSEQLGSVTSLLTSGLLGAGIGGLANKLKNRDAGFGALTGGAIGLGVGGLASLAGAVAAAIRKRRTEEAQRKYETGGSALANYLIPGSSVYNAFKRLGYSSNYDDAEKKRKREREDKATDLNVKAK